MSLIDVINEKYECDLSKVKNTSKNTHYVAYSTNYGKKIFVKIFYSKKRYLTELSLLGIVSYPKLIGNYELGDNYAIIQEFVKMENIDDLSTLQVYEYGKLLATFHKNMTKNKSDEIRSITRDETTLFTRTDKLIEKLEAHKDYRRITEIYSKLSEFEAIYVEEYNSMPKVVIHGDFGFRNTKIINGEAVLIDFERSKYDIAWMDLIKFFNREIPSSIQQDEFIKGYNSVQVIMKPSSLLQMILEFYAAIGIYSYTMEIEDAKFEEMADQMISNVEKYCSH